MQYISLHQILLNEKNFQFLILSACCKYDKNRVLEPIENGFSYDQWLIWTYQQDRQ